MTKAEIRQLIKEKFKTIDRAVESAAILKYLSPLIPSDGLILAFEPLKDEPDITPLIDSLRSTNRLALIVGRGDAARIEPSGPIVLALVPGRAFDRSGGRLGRGGGTFDRILAGLSCPRIGVCFDCQVVGSLPVEAHDVRMNTILTGRETISITS